MGSGHLASVFDINNICRSCLRRSPHLKSVFDSARTEHDEIDNWLQYGNDEHDETVPDAGPVPEEEEEVSLQEAIHACTQIKGSIIQIEVFRVSISLIKP